MKKKSSSPIFIFSYACALMLFASSSLAEALPPQDGRVDAIVDPALRACIRARLEADQLPDATQLRAIRCPRLHIASLDGVEIFTQTTTIDLSGNALRDLRPLLSLRQSLKYLNIAANPLPCRKTRQTLRQLDQTRVSGFDPINCVPDAAPEVPGGDSGGSAPAGYQDIAPIVAKACGPCHQNGKSKGGVTLNNAAELAQQRDELLEVILSGEMPPKVMGWKTTASGQQLVAYLKGLSPLPPQHGGTGKEHGGKHGHDDDEHDDDDHDDDD